MFFHLETFAKDYFYANLCSVALIFGKTLLLVVSKMMVIPNEKTCYAKALLEVVLHELLCRKLGKFSGEIEENNFIHPRLFDVNLLLCIAGEQLRYIVFLQHTARMFRKGNHHRGTTLRLRNFNEVAQQVVVALVNTVKKTDGCDHFSFNYGSYWGN